MDPTATATDVLTSTATPIATAVGQVAWVTSGGFDVGTHLAWGILALATIVALLAGVLVWTVSPMGHWGRQMDFVTWMGDWVPIVGSIWSLMLVTKLIGILSDFVRRGADVI